MANLIVRLLVRVKIEGKRSWVAERGKEPVGSSYYTQHCIGSQPEYKFVGKAYLQAAAAS